MHEYLKAIGFESIYSKKELNKVLYEAANTFTRHELVSYERGLDFCEFKKEYGDGIGIAVCGEKDEDEVFEREYYFPYFEGSGVTSYADMIVDKRMDRQAYIGVCEDIKVGVSLIFHLTNGVEYMKEKESGRLPRSSTSLTLSGLALSGTVLFGIKKSKEQEQMKKEESRNRMMLLSAARSGDQSAMESLTLDDIDTYSRVSRRLVTEDVFSIVDTYFMPYGVECDQYSIMGEILDYKIIKNHVTNEEIYVMNLDVNELQFDVCVPKEKVVGEMKTGRRFKANIWLQGQINF